MPPPAYIITQTQYDNGCGEWLKAIDTPTALTTLFGNPINRRTRVAFPLEQAMELLSTVGADRIAARFFVRNNEEVPDTFHIVLFATGPTGVGESRQRMSAYYLSSAAAPAAAVRSTDTSDGVKGGEVPSRLVLRWTEAWRACDSPTSSLFEMTNDYGKLNGYTFPIKDFVQALAAVDTTESYLQLSFGLHSYYAPDTTSKSTFGLILHAVNPSSEKPAPFFDMSSPCPPMCGE